MSTENPLFEDPVMRADLVADLEQRDPVTGGYGRRFIEDALDEIRKYERSDDRSSEPDKTRTLEF